MSAQQFKAGDILKRTHGFYAETRLMFIKDSKKDASCFHGILIEGDDKGLYSKTWAYGLWELANDPTPSQAEKADPVSPSILEAAKEVVNAFYFGKERLSVRMDRPIEQLQNELNAYEHATTEQVPPLPERWAIKRTPENAKMVNEWFSALTQAPFYDDYGYLHYPHGVGQDGGDKPSPDYAEITTAQFIAHVQKQS